MILKGFKDKLNAMLMPVQDEIEKAQLKTTERIQNTLMKAEKDVTPNLNKMSDEQRIKAAEREWENTEVHLLSAISSLYKSLLYLSPSINRLLEYSPLSDRREKDVKGKVID